MEGLAARLLEGALEIGVVFIASAVVVTYFRSVCRFRLLMDLLLAPSADEPDYWFKASRWLRSQKIFEDYAIDQVFPTVQVATVVLLVPVFYHVFSSEQGIQLWDYDDDFFEHMLSLATGAYVGSWFHNKIVVKWYELLGNALKHAFWGLLFCGLSYVPIVNIPLESWLPIVVRLSEPLAGSGFWNHFLYGLVAWAFVGLMVKFVNSLIGVIVIHDWKCSGLYCATLIVVGHFVWGSGMSASLYYVVAGWALCNLPTISRER